MVQDRPSNESYALAVYGDGNGFGARVFQSADDAVVAVAGEIDLGTATMLRQAIQDARRCCGRVVIDMADTTFIDSSGLHVLLDAQRDLGPRSLLLRSVTPDVRRIFAISGMDHLVTLLPDGA